MSEDNEYDPPSPIHASQIGEEEAERLMDGVLNLRNMLQSELFTENSEFDNEDDLNMLRQGNYDDYIYNKLANSRNYKNITDAFGTDDNDLNNSLRGGNEADDIKELLRRERESNELMINKFSSCLKELEELKSESKEFEVQIKKYHQDQAAKNSENNVIEDEKRLSSVIEHEEEQDLEQSINLSPQKSYTKHIDNHDGSINIKSQPIDEDDEADLNTKNQEEKLEPKITNDLYSQENNMMNHSFHSNNSLQEDDDNINEEEEIEPQDSSKKVITFDYKNPIHRFAEANKDLELIAMEQEDRASKIYENAIHQRKFKQKDAVVPLKHTILATSAFFNTPVCENCAVQEPAKESFTKYMANMRPIDLSKTKFRVLWSKEKVAKEKEEKRRLKEKAKLDKRNKFISNLSNILDSNNCNKAIFKSKNVLSNEYKSKPDKAIEYAAPSDLASAMTAELVQNITGRLYPSKADIIYQKILFNHGKIKEKLTDYIKDIQIPNIRDFTPDYEKLYKESSKVTEIIAAKQRKHSKQNNKNNRNNLHVIEEDIMAEISGDFDNEIIGDNQPLVETLRMFYSNKDTTNIEIKSEQNLKELDLKTLVTYRNLKDINFSMNNIDKFKMSDKRELSELVSICISQNKIQKLDKNIFSKCPNLKIFIADLNLLTSMEGIDSSTSLKHINLSQNKISKITNLQKLVNLTKLELNNNDIEQVDGIENCKMLQHLNLSKNNIKQLQKLQSNMMLTELILYSNLVEIIPKNFSFPILKLLKISMNKITLLRIGYCPMLETIDAKDNLISQIDCFFTCPSLKSFDVSFNQLQNIIPILNAFSHKSNCCLQQMKFNDNPFIANRYCTLELYSSRFFPNLKEINSLHINQLKSEYEVSKCIELGDLIMFEASKETEKARQFTYEVMNFLTLHQSEKFYIQKRINSKISIDYLFTSKFGLLKNEMLAIESCRILCLDLPITSTFINSLRIIVDGYQEMKK